MTVTVSVCVGIADSFADESCPVPDRAARLRRDLLRGVTGAEGTDVESHGGRDAAVDEARLRRGEPPGPLGIGDEGGPLGAGVIVEPGEEAAGLVEDELPPVRGDPLGREVRLVDAHVAVLADVDAEDDVARGGRATRATARCREGD